MPLPDIVSETKRIFELVNSKNLKLRLLGGLAIKLHCPSASHRSLKRKYPDIDFVGLSKQGREIKELFSELGYQSNKRFNAVHGRKRLLFYDTENGRQIDVFLDFFEMCHGLDLRKRLEKDPRTIPLEDLLITKLQIVEMNEKDIKDIITILNDHELGPNDNERIDVSYIASLCSDDWGLYKTLTLSIEKIADFLSDYQLKEEEKELISNRLNRISKRLEDEPKSLKWKMRDRIGERQRWYELPEEVQR
ncbi:MAG: hypothetical protein ACE5K0_08485 [Candidatus Methanofastidiosia archaeon]